MTYWHQHVQRCSVYLCNQIGLGVRCSPEDYENPASCISTIKINSCDLIYHPNMDSVLVLLLLIPFGLSIEIRPWPENVSNLTMFQNESELTIADLDIRYLSSKLMQNLHSVTSLELRYGHIDKAYVKPELQKLDMYHTKTTEVEIDPSQSYQTIVLEVTLCLLTRMPRHLCRLTNVTKLSFFSNEIEYVNMDELNQLQYLEIIDLSKNRIVEFGATVEISLPKLAQLFLSRNQLSSFEVCHWQLPNLQEVGLSSNNLSHIVLNPPQFPNLQTIKLHFNPLNCEWLGNFRNKLRSDGILKAGLCLNKSTNTSIPKDCTESDFSKCGQCQLKFTELIVNGQDVIRGSSPWHAALYRSNGSHFSYACGGTLISRTFVLTAAHCVIDQETKRTISRRFLLVKLGMHVLDEVDLKIQEFKVKKIYKYENFSQHTDDIALLELDKKALFTVFVQPACIHDSGDLVGSYGTVVGWGLRSDDKLAPVLQSSRMPVQSVLHCLRSSRLFFGKSLDEGMLCAGYTNGTSICNGDSGGGLYFQRNGRWFVGGIVSFSESRPSNNMLCKTDGFGVFTNVTHHAAWIRSIVKF